MTRWVVEVQVLSSATLARRGFRRGVLASRGRPGGPSPSCAETIRRRPSDPDHYDLRAMRTLSDASPPPSPSGMSAHAWHREFDLVLEPTRGFSRVHLRELVQFRELLYFLVKREILVRYKQSVFGVAWAVLQPLAYAFIFALFFGRLAKVPSEGLPYLHQDPTTPLQQRRQACTGKV